MSSKFETGHFINLSNFKTLLSYINSLPAYSPDADEIKSTTLTDLCTRVETATNDLIASTSAFQELINDRQRLFAQTMKHASRIVSYLEANISDDAAIKDVKTYYNLLASRKLSRKEKIAADGSISEKTYSTSRMSYHSRAENFQKMVERISTIDGYSPTEAGSSLTALRAAYQALHDMNENVNAEYNKMNMLRNKRDILMYKKDTGLVDSALRVKKYLKFKFGDNSEEYRTSTKLIFRKKQIRIADTTPVE